MKILQPISEDIDICGVVLSNGLVFFISEHNGGLSIKSDNKMFAEHSQGEVVIRTLVERHIPSCTCKLKDGFNWYGPHHNITCPFFMEQYPGT